MFSASFDDARIHEYLKTHYDGRCDLLPLSGEEYILCRCRACFLIYQRDVPNEQLLLEIYDEWLPSEERVRLFREYDLDNFSGLAEQVHWLIKQSGRKPCQLKVLDFGLGWSEWAAMSRAYGVETYGVELSKERVAYAKSIGIQIIGWDDIPGAGFDFINAEQVFEHLIDPLGTLRHLKTGLEGSGIIKVSVPDGRHMKRFISGIPKLREFPKDSLMPIHPLEHINCFTTASLDTMARVAGCKPANLRIVDFYDSASGWISARRAARNLLRPIYRHVWPRSTCAFFSPGI